MTTKTKKSPIRRKINVGSLSESAFEQLIVEVNRKVCGIMEEAQKEANTLLSRFGMQVSLTADYFLPDTLAETKKTDK